MSHTSLGLISCPEIQAKIDAFAGTDPGNINPFHENSFANTMMSAENRRGSTLQAMTSPGDGKTKTVDLIYRPRVLKSEVDDKPTKVCVSTKKSGMKSASFNLDIRNDGVSDDQVFDIVDLAEICQPNNLWIGETILQMMAGLDRKVDDQMIAQANLLFGTFARDELQTNPANNLKSFASKDSDGKPDPEFLQKIWFAATNAGYVNTPWVFGWTNSWLPFRTQQLAGCCNDGGVNITEMARAHQAIFFPNSNVEETLGVNRFFMMDRGALQPIWWNEFMGERGINVIDTEHLKRTIFVSPFSGIPYDFIWNENNCGEITINLKWAFKLVGMPDDMFDIGDRLEGVTRVNELEISNP